jgi:DNA repair protein RadC
MKIKSEESVKYAVSVITEEDAIIKRAIEIVNNRIKDHGILLNSPGNVADYIKLKYANLEHELFIMFHLNSQNRLIEESVLFRGTLNGCSVYPREVLKDCLKHNSKSVIIVHNHPSGNSKESEDDKRITNTLIKALEYIDVRVLDHLIVGKEITSFAEKGLL